MPAISIAKAPQPASTNPAQIRNFCIIAHIDHGKSTLADRLIQSTGTVKDRDMKAQMLDSMDIEKERGITIKAQTAALSYKARDGQLYHLNLIDTPGHVDFSYEVSRSLSACEGALLVVDASQGVEAQTVANCYTAIELGVEVVPVLNKIDLPSADPDKAKQEIEDIIGLDASNAVLASAKEGIGIKEILEQVVELVPAPIGDPEAPLKALIFDSYFDTYRGIIPSIRIVEGTIQKGDIVRMMATEGSYEVIEVGVLTPKEEKRDYLGPGDVGFFTASIKNVEDIRVGDTVTNKNNPSNEPLPGYRTLNPMVFCGMFPIDSGDYNDLREALGKLKLNDASSICPVSSLNL